MMSRLQDLKIETLGSGFVQFDGLKGVYCILWGVINKESKLLRDLIFNITLMSYSKWNAFYQYSRDVWI